MIMCVMTLYKNKTLWCIGVAMKAAFSSVMNKRRTLIRSNALGIKAKIEKVNEKLLRQIDIRHFRLNSAFAIRQTIYECLLEKYKT